MLARWVDPHVRRGLALAVVLLSLTGLVLADPAVPNVWDSARGSGSRVLVPDPRPSDPASRTSAPFDGRGVHGRFAVSHGRLLASGTRPMWVEIRAAAEAREGEVSHVPVAMVLVIDTSGSMSGQKLREAKDAATAMLGQMRDDDEVALIRYSSDAELVVPLSQVREVRGRAREQIERMTAGGNTNIARALSLASDLARGSSGDRTRRVVLVSDGRDTSGAPRDTASRLVRDQSARGITVSTLGIGFDYDDAYLADLADVGHGNYEFVRDGTALSRFLAREFREASRTTVQDVVAHLDLPPGVRVRDVWGATWDQGSGSARLSLGSLFAGDERRILVGLEVETKEPGSSLALRGEVSWIASGGPRVEVSLPTMRVDAVASAVEVDDARDLSVLASVASVTSSNREVQAAAAFEKGDRARAIELNQQNVRELDSMASRASGADAERLRAQKRVYEENQHLYATQPPAAAAAPAKEIGARERKNAAKAMAY